MEFDGKEFTPCLTADSIGTYLFVPALKRLLNITLDHAIFLLFGISMVIFSCIGLMGLWYTFKAPFSRCINAIAISFLIICFLLKVGDIYALSASFLLPVIPWTLYFMKKDRLTFTFALFALLTGVDIGLAHYLRSYSDYPIILFVGILFLSQLPMAWIQKSIIFIIMIIGFSSIKLYVDYNYHDYVTRSSAYITNPEIELHHPLWFTLYVGFGLLTVRNQDSIQYADDWGLARAKAVSGNDTLTVYDAELYTIMKQEVYNLVRYQWNFVLITLFAKLGILFLYFLIYTNIGIIMAYFYRKPWQYDAAFLSIIAVNMGYPLVALPLTEFALGFVVSSTLYGLVSISYAIQQGLLLDLSRMLYIKRNLAVTS